MSKHTETELRSRIDAAIVLAKDSMWYVEYPDNNHATYFIDQMIRILAGDDYSEATQGLWYEGEPPRR